MPVFEIHLVKVWVGVGPGTVGVVMFNVIMLMAGMRMGVGHLAVVVLVLVVMGCGVLVGFGHLVAPSLAGSVVADLDGGLFGSMPLVIYGQMVDMSKSFVEQCRNVGIEEPVDHMAPRSVADHETQISKYSQLMRDGRLLHLHLSTEVAHRARPGP